MGMRINIRNTRIHVVVVPNTSRDSRSKRLVKYNIYGDATVAMVKTIIVGRHRAVFATRVMM